MKKKDKKSGIVAEFKKFITRGNVVDMAVGIILGSAFTKIITSLVNSVIMPAIGLLIGGGNINEWRVEIAPAQLDEAGNILVEASYISYGIFIQAIIDFFLIALVIFTMVKIINGFRKRAEAIRAKLEKEKEEEPTPAPAPAPKPDNVILLEEIRDLLKEVKQEQTK